MTPQSLSPRKTLVLGRRAPRHDPWVLGAACVPLLPVLVLASYLARARIRLGVWPTGEVSGARGAVELGMEVHQLLVVIAANLLLVAPFWILAVVGARWVMHGDRRRMLPGFLLGAGLWAAAMAWVYLDPGELVAWALGPVATLARL